MYGVVEVQTGSGSALVQDHIFVPHTQLLLKPLVEQQENTIFYNLCNYFYEAK